MILPVKMNDFNYDVVIEKGCINNVNEYLDLNRKVLILTDSLVPINYSNIVKEKSKEGYIYTIASGEASKSFENYGKILDYLVEHQFSRTDCIVAVGGGVVGDLAGFVASTYMRGITFYNIPTTLLSQVDSSIGGKTAIDKCGIKNIVGAFYPPHKVLIDTDLLKTLDDKIDNTPLTVTGKTIGENLENVENKNTDVIHPLDNPVHADGGIAILKGNIAPNGSVVKKGAVVKNSILMQGTFVAQDATVNCVVADKSVVITPNKTLSGAENYPVYIGKEIVI